MLTRLLPIAALGMLCALTTQAATPARSTPTPLDVVRAFNAALSQRRLEAAMALLAPGAVNFQLQSAHRFTGASTGQDPLTVDLAGHWRSITPILYSTNRRYERSVADATVHFDGHLAVIWARLKTLSEPLQGAPTLLVFHETYLLREQDGQWRIIGIANSRQTR